MKNNKSENIREAKKFKKKCKVKKKIFNKRRKWT